MNIRTKEELQMFEEAIDRCQRSLLLLTPDGKQYDLKNRVDRYQGIARLMSGKDWESPELFTTCAADEMILFDYFEHCAKAG